VFAQSGCTATGIQGNYGYAAEGFLANGDTKTQIAELGNIEFRAGGTIAGNYILAIAGAENISGTFTGTYEVASDCSGIATLDSGGEKSQMVFVVGARTNTLFYATSAATSGGNYNVSGIAGRTQVR